MPNRPHGRARTTPGSAPSAICDRCGFLYNLDDLVFQYDFQGGSTPQKLNILVCTRTCLDALNYNNMLLILPPDPPPTFNARPEFFDVDETSWLTTQDEDIIDTQDGENLITSLPNPASTAVVGENSIVEEAAWTITTEDGDQIVTEAGDGNPLNINPNPGTINDSDGS